jgi:hypothetical protein
MIHRNHMYQSNQDLYVRDILLVQIISNPNLLWFDLRRNLKIKYKLLNEVKRYRYADY